MRFAKPLKMPGKFPLKLILTLAVSLGHFMAGAQEAEPEAKLKAVFIYNFTKYIEWHESAPSDFVIGVAGRSAVRELLLDISKANKAQNRNIVVREFSKPEEIEHCNILFISESFPYPLRSVMSRVDAGMVTVTEKPGYASLGADFNFVIVNDKLKFEVNIDAINQSQVKVSSQLLKLAIIVE